MRHLESKVRKFKMALEATVYQTNIEVTVSKSAQDASGHIQNGSRLQAATFKMALETTRMVIGTTPHV